MTIDRNNHFPPDRDWTIESLPAEFGQESIEVDRLIAHAACAEARHVPAGLSDRVFEMSVDSLPGAENAPHELRLVGVEAETEFAMSRRPRMFAAWARLALAASVLLVAGVTMWTTWPTHITPIAVNQHGVTPQVTNVALNLDDLNDLNASNPSAFDSYESEFAYLLDASEVRSFDDLNDDLVLLVQQLEM